MAAKHPHPAGKDRGAIPPGQMLFMRLLLGVAALIALYLAWLTFSGRNAVGCGPESGCQRVLNSRWAYWFGIPVSLLGAFVYAVTLGASMKLAPGRKAGERRRVWRLLVPSCLLILGGALWFTAIQGLILKHFCPFCLSAHAAASLAALLLLVRAPLAPEPEKSWQKEKEVYVPPRLAAQLAGAAALGLAVLTLGQWIHQPARYREASLDAGSSVTTNQATARVMQLFEGQVQLLLNEVPILGKPDAPFVMVDLHDFTCNHCRTMHLPLKTLQRTFSNQLAVVSLPMPLDGACNPHVRVTPQPHSNACDYARLSLAVWRAQPVALEPLSDWLFTPLTPPPFDQALAHARQLVGPEKLDQAMRDPWVEDHLQKSLAIYGLNLKLNGSGSMPQFIIGTNAIFGQLSLNTLFQKVTNQFPLRWPPGP